MPPIAVHSFQEPHQPQMVRHSTLLAPMDEASKHTCQVCPVSRKGSPRTRRDKREHTQKLKPSKMTMVLTQHHTRWTEIHSHHHKDNNSISTHRPPQQVPQHGQIVVQQDPSTAAVLRQMAQLHQQHFETSQTQTKVLENIASASSFTSTVGCIPIYNGKDKDACTEWLQRCKEASY